MNLRQRIFRLFLELGAATFFVGCASNEKRYEGVGQWVVMSTNAVAPRVTATNINTPVSAPIDRDTAKQNLRSAIEATPVSTGVLQKVSDGKPLALEDLAELARHKIPDEPLLDYLRSMDVVYVLTTADIERLRAEGLSAAVLDELLASRMRPTIVPRYDYYPAYRPYHYYYYDPFWYGPRPYYYHYHRHYPRSVIRKR